MALRDVTPYSSEEVIMTRIIDTESKRRLPAQLAAGLAVSALLAVGAFVAPAGAQVVYGAPYYGPAPVYSPPPVVYAQPYYAPYYAPPPVVYGPTIGIGLPFIGIGVGGRRR
jgi:hypothetical protein